MAVYHGTSGNDSLHGGDGNDSLYGHDGHRYSEGWKGPYEFLGGS